MLRIAVPNKGSLSERATAMLAEAGYRQRRDPKELVLTDAENEVEFFYLRPRDIAVYVGSGDLDLGVTGRDLLLDSGADADEMLALGFGRSTFRFAARPGTVESITDLAGRRIATSYAGLVRTHLAEHGVAAEVIRLDGAVETAIRLGVADVIADVVETGATLRQQGLEIVAEPILRSEAVVIRGKGQTESGADHRVDQLTRRLNGVLVAARYVMLAYDVELARLDDAVAITPGIEGPTISPLHKDGWVAVQAMVPKEDTNRIMDALYDLGARAILVTSIHACRL
ncbi:ATP phosphoribosyltransferase [Cryptosporangium minutisporangium]|uniref:ATP phosphoribosyltransferase n=1 Tax=Cryptosporangium minutisporangium TaxID=113569 RepID=A0ABP6SRN0_9ACTN